MRNLTVSTGESRETSRLTRKTVSWDAVKRRLGTHARMSVTMAEYLALEKNDQTAHKDRGYYVLGAFSNDLRRNEEFQFRDAVVLDIDDAPVDLLMRLHAAYRGTEVFIHSTTKHQVHKPRFRVVMPTDRRMSPVEFEALSRAVAAKLDIALVDPISFRAAQMVFFPVVPSDAPVVVESWAGAWLAVDATLDSTYLDWTDRGEWPRKAGDLGGTSDFKKLGDPREKKGLIGAFCRAYDVHRALDELIPGVYEGEGQRRRFAQSEGGAGAAIYDDGHWLFSNHTGHDPAADGHSHNAYDLVRIHRFGGDDAAMRSFAVSLADVADEMPALAPAEDAFEEVESVDQDTGEITKKMVPVSQGLFEAIASCGTPDGLRGAMVRRVAAARLGPLLDSQLCKAIADRLKAIGDVATTVSAVKAEVLAARRAARGDEDGEGVDYFSPLPVTGDKGMPKACWENLREILKRLGVVARYNVMNKREEVLIPERGFSQDNRDNASLAYVKSECAKFNMPVGDIMGLLTLLSDEAPYNPMATWIDSKPWDGVDRVKAICSTVITDPIHTRLKDVMIRRWLTAAVACAFEPDGVAVQGVLVFQGAQGIGKSTWLTNLAPSGMTADGVILRTDNPDSKREALGRWLVELAELDATFKKSDIESLKAFITKKCDEIRAPYAAKASMWARRTVFFASVNPKHFLHDTTGNRRFWVVPVVNLKRDHGVDMQQMWAQVKVEWANGARFTLSEDELAGLSKSNAAHSSENPIQVLLEDSYDWHAPHDQWLWKTRKQIMADCGTRGEPSVRVLADLARVLDERGCERKTVRGVPMQRIPPILRLGEDFEEM